MAFKVFSGGATLPAADLNDYLMEQSIIVCTSGTRPSSPAEGWTIYETDTDLYLHYSGSAWVTLVQPGAWTSYSPGLYQDTTKVPRLDVPHTNTYAKYRRHGRSVLVEVSLAVTGSTSAAAANLVEVALPITAAASAVGVGIGYIYDASANLTHKGIAYLSDVDRMSMIGTASTSPSGLGVADFTAQFASGDAVVMCVEYEAAS